MILVVVVGGYETDINSIRVASATPVGRPDHALHGSSVHFLLLLLGGAIRSEQCLQKYTYCTKGLQSATYKQLTCPIQKECPQVKFVTHKEHWSPVKTQLVWEKGSKSINCRVIVKGTLLSLEKSSSSCSKTTEPSL